MEKPFEKKAFEHLLARLGGETLSFPHPVEKLELVQTHISIILLTETFAYKIKKPVNYPFVDYSSLKRRRDFCRREVELNRRLSHGVYLGVSPITLHGSRLELDGGGEIVEYAVKMRRLPDERRLNRLLERGELPKNFWAQLAGRLTEFYHSAARGPEISRWAEPSAVIEDWRQILDQLDSFPASLLDPTLRERFQTLSGEALDQNKRLLSLRVKIAREGHGDLRLEHIYFFPDQPEPENIQVIDCVEFNPRYRCCDPLCDAAFLAMDLEASGREDSASLFLQDFLNRNGNPGGSLMDFYVAYRHLVRGLVRGLQAGDEEEFPEDKSRAGERARLHFLLALGKLERPGLRPCLVLLGGLPGTGKSSLARQLLKEEGFRVFSSDAIRKELAGQPFESRPGESFEKGIYKPEWTEKTYESLLARTAEALRRGERVLVDASFARQEWREKFQALARQWRLPFLFFICMISRETADKRLSEERHFGSDADMDIYRKMAGHWEPPSPELGTLFLNTERPLSVNMEEIHLTLVQRGLSEPKSAARAKKF